MKEYELYQKYNNAYQIEGVLDILSQAIYNKQLDLIDLDACEEKIKELFLFLKTKQRYDALNAQAKNGLYALVDRFELAGHSFDSLDEVERALKQKAFL